MALELATAYVSLSTSAKGLRKEIDREIGGVESGAQKRGKGIGGKLAGGIAIAAKAGLATAGAAAAAGFGTALVKGFGRLKAIEAAEAKLTGLGHSAESVAQIMANATAAVTGTAFGLGDAASAAASAVASGVKPGKELERTLKLVGDAAAIAGADYNDMAAIFNKISAGGVIQGEELAQLGDRGIPILQLLGEEMGVTAQEVRKLASEGKVDFETFQNAIESGMGGAALESGKTFQGAMNNVGAALGRLGANLLGGVFPKIAPMLQNVIKWLDGLMPVAEKVGKAVGDALSWIGDAATALFDVFVKGDFNKTFREAFGVEEDHPIVGVLFNIRDTAITVWNEVTGGLKAFVAAWKFNDGEVTSSGFPGVMERIGYWARQAFDYIRNVAIPAVAGFIAEFRNGEGAGGKFRDILQGVYNIGKQAFTWFRDEGLPALQALGDFILNTLWPDIRTAFIERIWPAMQEVGRVVKAFWENDAQPALKGFWVFVRDILAPFLVAFYHEGVKPTFDLVGRAISGAWNNVIKPTFRALKDGGDGLKRNFTTVKDHITTAWDVVSTSIRVGWDTIKGIFDKFKSGLSSLRDRFVSIRDGIRDVWRGLGNIIARPINSVIDKINGFLSGLKGALNRIPGVDLTGNWSIRKIILDQSNATVGGGSRVALASGGVVPGHSPHHRADNILARLTAGEFVLPVKATARIAKKIGASGLEWLRRGMPDTHLSGPSRSKSGAHPHGLPKYADGGLVGNVMDWVGKVWDGGKGAVQALYDRLLGGIGDSWPAQAARGAIGSTAGKLAEWIKSLVFGGEGGEPGWPVPGRVTSRYGPRYLPGLGYDFHAGTDFAAGMGTPVRAVGAGRAYVGSSRGGGTHVGIAHPGGLHSGYLHLSRALVAAGANVAKGQVIAASGNTGAYTTGPHLHFQLGRGGNFWSNHFDPLPWLQRGAKFADGGLVKPFVADSGVRLAPGLNMIDNRTGGPEPLGRLDVPTELGESTLRRLEAMQRRVAIDAVREEVRALRQGLGRG